jgi:hypothetical protein
MLTLSPTRTAGGSFGTILVGSSTVMAVYAPDSNLNRLEMGTSVASRWSSPASPRGGTMVINSTAGLDGYGFLFQRVLVDAAGTGPCNTAQLVCRWRVLFGGWEEGHIADVQLNAGTAPATPTAQTATVDVTVRSVTTSISASGTVE